MSAFNKIKCELDAAEPAQMLCLSREVAIEVCLRYDRLRAINAELLAALVEIQDHWACQYDHPRKAGEMYAGPYGIGVTDGHRAAAIIARKAIAKAKGEAT